MVNLYCYKEFWSHVLYLDLKEYVTTSYLYTKVFLTLHSSIINVGQKQGYQSVKLVYVDIVQFACAVTNGLSELLLNYQA